MQKATNTKTEHLFWALSALIPIVLMFAVLHTPTRAKVRNALLPEYRKILSASQGDLLGTGEPIKVLKIRSRDSIYIEVHNTKTNELVDRFPLEQSKDGHFTFHGEITNLALEDIDADMRPEILAPAFDDSLIAHLNVYKYDPVTKSFFRLTHDQHPQLVSFNFKMF